MCNIAKVRIPVSEARASKKRSSVPCFVTDSSCLAPIFHRSGFVGEGLRLAEGLRIRCYELEKE